MEFWESMATNHRQARSNQSRHESRHEHARSTTGQFFEDFANRSEDLKRHWQERLASEGANAGEANGVSS